MVASPCVVGVNINDSQVLDGFLSDVSLSESLLDGVSCRVGVRSDDNEFLALGYLGRHVDISLCDVVEYRRPVGVGMRPCQLYRPLLFPFSWQP